MTIKNMVEVLRLVKPANLRKVISMIFPSEASCRLNSIDNAYPDIAQLRLFAYADYIVNKMYSNMDWRNISGFLYSADELDALKKARSFIKYIEAEDDGRYYVM